VRQARDSDRNHEGDQRRAGLADTAATGRDAGDPALDNDPVAIPRDSDGQAVVGLGDLHLDVGAGLGNHGHPDGGVPNDQGRFGQGLCGEAGSEEEGGGGKQAAHERISGSYA
jgi:hypothetical protein